MRKKSASEVKKMAEEKLKRLRDETGITEEQEDILYAIAMSNSIYYSPMQFTKEKKDIEKKDIVYGIKANAISAVAEKLNVNADFYLLEELFKVKSTLMAMNYFVSLYDESECVVCADVHINETDIVDYVISRTRFIVSKDDEEIRVHVLGEELDDLRLYEVDYDEIIKSFPELANVFEADN
ncbi:MAG: hypothetical protein K1W34_14085 [Lachnospiraceae bacterium]